MDDGSQLWRLWLLDRERLRCGAARDGWDVEGVIGLGGAERMCWWSVYGIEEVCNGC